MHQCVTIIINTSSTASIASINETQKILTTNSSSNENESDSDHDHDVMHASPHHLPLHILIVKAISTLPMPMPIQQHQKEE